MDIDTEEKLRDIFVDQLDMDESLWDPELTFEELAVDSLDMTELLVTIEDAFDIDLAAHDDELAACENVGQFVKIVLACLEDDI